MQTSTESPSGGWRRPVWLALLVTANVAFTLGLAEGLKRRSDSGNRGGD
jgi:hypothetical protein